MIPLPLIDPSFRRLEIDPRSPARDTYCSVRRPPATALEREALLRFNQGRIRADLPPAVLDPLLGEVAEAYARLLAHQGAEAAACGVEALFDWVGLVDVYPTFTARSSTCGGDGGFLALLEDLGQRGAGRAEEDQEPGEEVIGIGRNAEPGGWVHVLSVLRRMVWLDPFPRQLEAGSKVRLTGRLSRGVEGLQAFTLCEGGLVQPIACRVGEERRFVLDWEMPLRPGWVMVELVGTTMHGPRVLARFSVTTDTPDSKLLLLLPPEGEAELEEEQAGSRFLQLVNNARKAYNVPPLEPDRLAAAVAANHAREMARQGYTGHLSSGTGNPGDRFRHAGLAVTLLAECVARDRTISSAYLALMRSLSHRRILLDSRFLGAGVGVAAGLQGEHREWLVACDLFRPLAHPDPEAGIGELAREIAMLRSTQDAPPLTPDGGLRRAARALAASLLDPGGTDATRLRARLGEEMRGVGIPVEDYTAIVQVVMDPLVVAQAEGLTDNRWTHLGIGIQRVPDTDGPPVAVVAVVLARRLLA